MKEKNLISLIKTVLASEYIGDDCACLKDLGIVVTQDSLVEDVHFCLKYMTPYQLGYKSVMVNISDVASSGAEPKYLTIALSLPANIEEDFVEQFYLGAKAACGEKISIVGGDITGSDKIMVSVCAIGKIGNRNISSRSNAKIGYKVVVAGLHGSSAAGLELLLDKRVSFAGCESLIKAHLEPQAQVEFGENIASAVKESYAMMDTSDGLMESLSTIASESGVELEVDFDKIPHDKNIERLENWQELVLFGGEDYGIIAVIPEIYDTFGTEIGIVKAGSGVNLKINGIFQHYSKVDVDNKIYNHFA